MANLDTKLGMSLTAMFFHGDIDVYAPIHIDNAFEALSSAKEAGLDFIEVLMTNPKLKVFVEDPDTKEMIQVGGPK